MPDLRPAPGHRFWMPAGIALLAAVGIGAVYLQPELERNYKGWITSAILLLATLLTLLWFLFLSRFRGRIRLATFAAIAVLGLVLSQLLRLDGTSDGKGLPQFAWKWRRCVH